MIRHRIFLVLLALQVAVLVFLLTYGQMLANRRRTNEMAGCRQITRMLELTDLSLWSEARYARHPVHADFFSPFQEFPGAIEHFPAGSIIAPPPHLRASSGRR